MRQRDRQARCRIFQFGVVPLDEVFLCQRFKHLNCHQQQVRINAGDDWLYQPSPNISRFWVFGCSSDTKTYSALAALAVLAASLYLPPVARAQPRRSRHPGCHARGRFVRHVLYKITIIEPHESSKQCKLQCIFCFNLNVLNPLLCDRSWRPSSWSKNLSCNEAKVLRTAQHCGIYGCPHDSWHDS